MHWSYSNSSFIWIFPVGRGSAAFVRSGLNQGFLIDMGGGELCDPASFVQKNFLRNLDAYKDHKIAQVVLSHPHTDHISQCEKLENGLKPQLLTLPHDKDPEGTDDHEKLNWNRIQNPRGSEALIGTYRSLYRKRQLPLQTIEFQASRTIPNLEYGIFYVKPPKCELLHPYDDNKYGNATSIMFYYRHANNTILFPGDMTPEGMQHVLGEREGSEKRYTVFDRTSTRMYPDWHLRNSDQPSLKRLLRERGLSILVAPHHGLESGFCTDLYAAMRNAKPQLVVISERRHRRETDGCIHRNYQCKEGASGLMIEVDGRREQRISMTTKDDHHILIMFESAGAPRVFASKDPERLLQLL